MMYIYIVVTSNADIVTHRAFVTKLLFNLRPCHRFLTYCCGSFSCKFPQGAVSIGRAKCLVKWIIDLCSTFATRRVEKNFIVVVYLFLGFVYV